MIGTSSHLYLALKFVDEAADILLTSINTILTGETATEETPLIGYGFPENVTFPEAVKEEEATAGIIFPVITCPIKL